MFTPTNPEGERIRAQAMLRSFTEHDKAVDTFGPMRPQGEKTELAADTNHNNGRSIMQFFKTIKLKSRTELSGLTQSQVEGETYSGMGSPSNLHSGC